MFLNDKANVQIQWNDFPREDTMTFPLFRVTF